MRLLRRLAHWLRLGPQEAALEEEMSFHRDRIAADLVAKGMAPADAAAAARRSMGNETTTREESRGVWLWPSLEAVLQDARATLRALRKSPAFTAGVLLTFALGVGANAAMFSLMDRLMFRAPPLMRDPSSAHQVYMYRVRDGVDLGTGGQYAIYSDFVRGVKQFSGIAGYRVSQLAIGVGQDAREMPVAAVSASFFDFFDAPPAAGRYYSAAEDAPPSPAPVAVLSYRMWQTRYASRADAIGSTLHIGAAVYTIIGVAPPRFVGLWRERPPVVFIPLSAYAASRAFDGTWATNYGTAIGALTMVRRRAGVSVAAASDDLTRVLIQSFRSQWAARGRSDDVVALLKPHALAGPVQWERGPERSGVARVASWLTGVAAIVLLIACANVASLLLARGLARRREVAVRLALGVSQRRLLSHIMTESVLLAVAGGVLGIGVAVGLSSLLGTAFFPGTELPPIATDLRTLAFTAAVTLALGLSTGVLPAWQARRLTITDDLKSGARSGQHRSRTRTALVVVQAALSLALLVGAGLFVRSLRHVRDVRLGFDADSVLVIEMAMRDVNLDSAGTLALRQRLLAAAGTVPGISHATLQFAVPFAGESSWPIAVEGIDSTSKLGQFNLNAVSPDYFATMGTTILRGQGIQPDDLTGSRRVMVVGASMGAVLWPGDDPLGKCVRIGIPPETQPCTEVVGIAEDIHSRSLGPESRLFYYYLPATLIRPQDGGLFARAASDAYQVIEPLRRRLQAEMPGSAYVTVKRLGAVVEGETRSWEMGATVFTAFGVLALVLTAVGLYSVIAYEVAQRRQELAVRVALGAAAGDVTRLVVGRGVRLAVFGVLAGGLVAVAGARWIAPLLFNQSARDPSVFGAVAGLLILVATVASAIPAWRGARVDPNAVLRSE